MSSNGSRSRKESMNSVKSSSSTDPRTSSGSKTEQCVGWIVRDRWIGTTPVWLPSKDESGLQPECAR